jgi:hypothetical protein
MGIIGIERIVYGVTDLASCSRYLNDWGFTPRTDGGRLAFETAEKTCVEIKAHDDPSLPPLRHSSAFFNGSCGREVIWGVDSEATLGNLRKELGRDREVTMDTHGTLHSSDCAGNPIGFCVTRRVPVIDVPAAFNSVGAPRRIDQPADGAAKTLVARPRHALLYRTAGLPALGQRRQQGLLHARRRFA